MHLVNHAVLDRRAPYNLAMRDAAERFVRELDISGLSRIAVMEIEGDSDQRLQDYLTEALSEKEIPSGKTRLQVMGRSALHKIDKPPTRDGFIRKLHGQHGVDAAVNGEVTGRKISLGLARVRLNLLLNRLPGQEIIHAESDLEGSAPLPVPFFLLYWLPYVILFLGAIMGTRGLLRTDVSTIPQNIAAQKQDKHTSADEVMPGTSVSQAVEANQVKTLVSLLKEILAVNTDVMILSRQNNLNQAADFLADLGRFVQEETSTIEKWDYTSADTADKLGLSGDDREELETLDESLAGLLQDLLARLEQALQTLHVPVVDLKRTTTLFETLKVKSDTIRETFRERLELLEVE